MRKTPNRATVVVYTPDGTRMAWETRRDSKIASDARAFARWLLQTGAAILGGCGDRRSSEHTTADLVVDAGVFAKSLRYFSTPFHDGAANILDLLSARLVEDGTVSRWRPIDAEHPKAIGMAFLYSPDRRYWLGYPYEHEDEATGRLTYEWRDEGTDKPITPAPTHYMACQPPGAAGGKSDV